jgi:hypothetical protein
MNIIWKHKATIFDGEKFEIQGLNIWDFEWKSTNKKINLKDPLYGKKYCFEIYKIENTDIEIMFAAGEFSNNVWAIYLK